MTNGKSLTFYLLAVIVKNEPLEGNPPNKDNYNPQIRKTHRYMKKFFTPVLAAIFMLLLPALAFAGATYDDFGSQPGLTFGGNGIPNHAVAHSNVNGADLFLTATARYGNTPVVNDGAGNFYAEAGGDTLNGNPAYARWNFGFAIQNLSIGQTVLLYMNPIINGPMAALIAIPVNYTDSWNFGMGFLNGGVFDPTATGAYEIGLAIKEASGQISMGNSIVVHTGDGKLPDNGGGGNTVPDTGSTLGLMALAIGAFGAARSRLNNSSSASPPVQLA